MKLLGLLIFIATAPQPGPPELAAAVAEYWDLIAQGDKNAALRFVAPESRNAFIKRREPFVHAWELKTAAPAGEGRFDVTVIVKTPSDTGFRELTVAESWFLKDGSWKVAVPDYSQALARLWKKPPPARPKPGKLEVLPLAVTIHFISPTQRGNILIRNGLEHPVQVEKLVYDAEFFEIEEKPEFVPPGEIRRLSLRYSGAETKKNLTSQIDLTLRHELQETSFTIPIRYNVVSPGTRALLGLTTEDAEQLKRGDSLTPAITPPSKPRRADSESSDGNREKRPEDKEL